MPDNSYSISHKIDIFTHILPTRYRQALYRKAQRNLSTSIESSLEAQHNHTPALFDMGIRFKQMDGYGGLRHVLTLVVPPLEVVASPGDAAELAQIANDETAELVTKYPDRFVAGVASLPMNDIDASLRETERAIEELHLKGIQLYTAIDDKPLDSPEFMPIYEKMAEYDLPIWLHPVRVRSIQDYKNEAYSKYRIFHVFGWPYETSAAMTRLVFSGVLEKFPDLKFITHHCGGMVPYFSQRLEGQGQAMIDKRGHFIGESPANLSRPVLEYFKKFYADTALGGFAPGLMCGYAFFGADHVAFGTDAPYGPERGVDRNKAEINAVNEMSISSAEKQKIFQGNAKRILRI